MALSNAQVRAMVIRRKVAANQNANPANDNDGNHPGSPAAGRQMNPKLLADCVASAGFEQHAAY